MLAGHSDEVGDNKVKLSRQLLLLHHLISVFSLKSDVCLTVGQWTLADFSDVSLLSEDNDKNDDPDDCDEPDDPDKSYLVIKVFSGKKYCDKSYRS